LNNGFGDDFDVYVQKLFKFAITKNIAAIGLTDYFTIDGYKNLKRIIYAILISLSNYFRTKKLT